MVLEFHITTLKGTTINDRIMQIHKFFFLLLGYTRVLFGQYGLREESICLMGYYSDILLHTLDQTSKKVKVDSLESLEFFDYRRSVRP